MKIRVIHVIGMMIAVILSVAGCASPATPAPTDTPALPTATAEPSATATAVPSPTLEPTATNTPIQLPQEWKGTYTYQTGLKQNIVLLIETIDGNTFTGKMIWNSFGNARGAILRMNGEYVTDFGTGDELTRWNNHPDFKNGETAGTWLKWTETEIISGRNYTVNGWYYAHIREDGTMAAVYFFNDHELVADSGKFVFGTPSP